MYLRDFTAPMVCVYLVCVPCVQPAGTVLGLFFSGPADNWGKAGRVGLPHRPWRFLKKLLQLKQPGLFTKTCQTSQSSWEMNKCPLSEIYLFCFKKHPMGGKLQPAGRNVFHRSYVSPGYLQTEKISISLARWRSMMTSRLKQPFSIRMWAPLGLMYLLKKCSFGKPFYIFFTFFP